MPTLLLVTSAAVSSASPLPLDDMVGVYRRPHTVLILNKDWEPAKSEDILEIVKVTESDAYLRVHLKFDNGHICDIYGIGQFSGNAFSFSRAARFGRRGATPGTCNLTIKLDHGKLHISDPGQQCRVGTCGARGYYDGAEFDLKSKRRIRYMPIILASREYKAALAEFERGQDHNQRN